jgi:outer membrane protein OmpA-like peptidoglycan-associated protein
MIASRTRVEESRASTSRTPTEVRIELAADVLFDFDKADLLPKAQQTLETAAQVIRDRDHEA